MWINRRYPFSNYLVDVRYTPTFNITRRHGNGKIVIDYAKPVKQKIARVEIPKRVWNIYSVGDTAPVYYALSKGKYYARVHNPKLSLNALFMLLMGAFFLLAAPLAIRHKWKRS